MIKPLLVVQPYNDLFHDCYPILRAQKIALKNNKTVLLRQLHVGDKESLYNCLRRYALKVKIK